MRKLYIYNNDRLIGWCQLEYFDAPMSHASGQFTQGVIDELITLGRNGHETSKVS